MPKKLLFVRADLDQVPDAHIDAFRILVQQMGVTFVQKDITTIEDFESALDQQYKYICFAGHGDENSIGNNGDISISWNSIGSSMCTSDSLLPNTKILMYCCYGGLVEVACSLMQSCEDIDYLIGPKDEQNSIDMLHAFSLFIYNRERHYTLGDDTCAHRVHFGTGIQVKHYSRTEYDQNSDSYICLECEQYRESQEE